MLTENQKVRLDYILNEAMPHWEYFSLLWMELADIAKESGDEQIKEATDHCWDVFQKDINGLRDHIKLALGRI